MYRKLGVVTLLMTAGALMFGCENEVSESGPSAGDDPSRRWYSAAQVELGRNVFRANCASCHGAMAQGAANWRERRSDGSFPPPPLNGRGHTWHHPFPMLREIVTAGGQRNMPAFGNKLSDKEVEAVLAYVSSLWPDRVYEAWISRATSR